MSDVKRLFVGNLPYDRCNDAALREVFEGFGVIETSVVINRETGKPRGFCFVELPANEVDKAIDELNEADVGGRRIVVNVANERKKGGEGRPRDNNRRGDSNNRNSSGGNSGRNNGDTFDY